MDNRKALAVGEELIFDSAKKYIIIEETGRGAGCLVYTASCQDNAGLTHNVRIKECFPYCLEIKRASDNTLQILEEFRQRFLDAKKKFCDAYKKNIQLKNTLGIMNSTVDSIELYQQNNTYYYITGIIEGTDYRRKKDSCLQDVFVRMEALCEIVRKYHSHGFLHLDIKPENILILPETREHIMLFDFDSVILKEDLHKESETKLTCSDRFSAPELVTNQRNSIGETADIYSVGAVVYFKIFDEMPPAIGCPLGTKFDFSGMNFPDTRYQPELYKKLNLFLQKTLSTSPLCRYQTMDAVICDLKELQKLSDIKAVFLHSRFSCHSACFVGRKRELSEIGRALMEHQAVFLSGMGGIGKTEIAKKYLYERQEDYRTIVFAGFYQSILETVCGQDFDINGIKREEMESKEGFFERKLGVLKNILTKNDLIILDNFDVEADEHLDELLDCPCRFLITTREDFRDYNYRQITIDKIEDIHDLTALVKLYNSEEYTEEELICIEHLIELVEYHTMTTELLAKYLRSTGEAPSVLLGRMRGIEGIVNTEDRKVKHRKDKKLRAESVVRHLRILFDLSEFSAGEEELMMSLSLLGAIRIRRETFLEYCGISNKTDSLDNLIRRGWIEFDGQTGKISLHQIILDLIYHDKKPTAENCLHITAAMTDYAGQSCANRTEKEVKHRFLNDFAQRISGNSLEFAEFLVAYCSQIRKRREYIERAEEISRGYLEKREEKISRVYLEKKAQGLMYEICRMKIAIEAEFSGMLLSELGEIRYLDEKSKRILSLAQSAYVYIQSCGYTKGDLGKACVVIAFELDHAVGGAEMYIEEDRGNEALDRLLGYASYLLERAEGYLLEADMPYVEKEKLFEKIQSFYSGEDYCAAYRSKNCGNLEKICHYQEILDELRKETKSREGLYLYPNDVTYFEMAQRAMEEGEIEKAEAFYKEEIEKGELPYEIGWKELAELYQKTGKIDEAEKCLEMILSIDKEQIEKEGDYWKYTSYVSAELICLLLSQGKRAKTEKYLKELLFYNETQGNIEWTLFGNYYLYKIEEKEAGRERLWGICLREYEKLLREGEISGYLADFVIEYLSKIDDKDKRTQKAVLALESCRADGSKEKERLISYALENCNAGHWGYIWILISCAKNLRENYQEEDTKEALAVCQRAEKLYKENGKEDEYVYSLIHKNIGACYLNMGNYDKGCEEMKKCNYYLLAKTQIMTEIQAETEIETKVAAKTQWEEAAEAYSFLENWEMAEKCWQERFSLPDAASGWYRFESFDECWDLGIKRLKGLFLQKRLDSAVLWEERLLKELFWQRFEFEIEKNTKSRTKQPAFETEKKIERRAERFAWKLKETADILADSGCQREAFFVYILSVTARLNLYPPKALFFGFLTKERDKEWIKQEFEKALQLSVTGKMIDFAVDVWRCIQKLNVWEDRKKEYEADMEWFLKNYEHQTIEFKR